MRWPSFDSIRRDFYEFLYNFVENVSNFALLYLYDSAEVPDFNVMDELNVVISSW